MSNKRLLIYDRDEKYAGSLMEYLNGIRDFPYTILAYSKEEALLEAMKEKPADLFLVSEKAYAKVRDKIKTQEVIILNESGELSWKEIFNIKKYQSAENIVQEILHYYVETSDVVPEKFAKHKDIELIGFFSPVRRCSQTTMGLSIGQILSEEKKTLYLNFESISGFPGLYRYNQGRTIEDLLYFLETSPEKFGVYLKSCIRKVDNLDFVPPINTMQSLLLVRQEQWLRLIKVIIEESDYERIVLDLSEGMQGLFEILRLCTHIYTFTGEDRYAKAKLEQYEQILTLSQYDDILDKTTKCRIPYIKEIADNVYGSSSAIENYARQMLKEDGLYG